MSFAIRPTSYWMNWHRVFLWRPVEITGGKVLWLETVERKYRWKGGERVVL